MCAAVLFFCFFLVFFLVDFLSSAVTRLGLMEPEMEMQLSGYHRCMGCNFSGLVSLRASFIAGSCARRYQESGR